MIKNGEAKLRAAVSVLNNKRIQNLPPKTLNKAFVRALSPAPASIYLYQLISSYNKSFSTLSALVVSPNYST